MKNRPRHICRGLFFICKAEARPRRGCFGLRWEIAAPPDGEAFARPARPTRSLRAPHRHDFDARAFTRALYAGGQNHAGPANVLSGASRLSGLSASLRPSFVAATALRQKNACRRNTPSASAQFAGRKAEERRADGLSVAQASLSGGATIAIKHTVLSTRTRWRNWVVRKGGWVFLNGCKRKNGLAHNRKAHRK